MRTMWILVLIFFRVLQLYSYLLLSYSLLSWFPALVNSRLGRFIDWLVQPVLRPFRRWHLQLVGIDLTVFLAWLTIRFVSYLLLRVWLLW